MLILINGEGQGSNLTSMKETIPQPLYRLSYFTYSECRDLNPGPPGPKPGALPTELHPEVKGSVLEIQSITLTDITYNTTNTLPQCWWWDLNPHAFRHMILSHARLPITPHQQMHSHSKIHSIHCPCIYADGSPCYVSDLKCNDYSIAFDILLYPVINYYL